MCCDCGTRIIQIGGGAFTFNVTSGDTPYNGGAGVDFGPVAINNGDTLHFYSTNTLNFEALPGSANIFAEVRLDPSPLNALSASVAGLYAASSGYTWNVGTNVGGPDTINNGDTWKATSCNNTILTTSSGLNTTCFDVNVDPNPNNILVVTPGGLFVDGTSLPIINIYNSDGTITDPLRTVTVGTATLQYVASDGMTGTTNIIQSFFNILQHHVDSITGNQTGSVITGIGTDIYYNNVSADIITQHSVTDGVVTSQATNSSGTGRIYQDIIWAGSLQRLGVTQGATTYETEYGAGYMNLNSQGSVMELQMSGNPGALGEVLTSQGAGATPIWAPVVPDITTISVTNPAIWDFNTNNWTINNVQNYILDADCIQLPAPRNLLDPNITGFMPALVIDPGTGCLSEQYMDRDWMTTTTTTPEQFPTNNAWRIGGIGVIGWPHGGSAPFDTQDLIFDIEVAGGTRNVIGVNTLTSPLGAEGSFQLLAPATGGNISWSAIAIGQSVDTGFGSIPSLVGPFGSPTSDNLMITHKSTTGGAGGDIPMYMLYGAGATNASAGHIFTDTGSVNAFSVPTELVTIGSVNRTPRLHIINDNLVGNDEVGILLATDANASRSHLGIGEYLNTGGAISSALTADMAVWSFLGAGAYNTYITHAKGGGVAITTGTGPTTTYLADLHVEGVYNNIIFANYGSGRDDSLSDPPVNFLYTDLTGNIRSAPTSVLPNDNIYNTDGTITSATRTISGTGIESILFNNLFRVQIGGVAGNVDEAYIVADTVNIGNGAGPINLEATIYNFVSMPPAYADDTAAGIGGLVAGNVYQTDGTGAAPLNVPGIMMIKQ